MSSCSTRMPPGPTMTTTETRRCVDTPACGSVLRLRASLIRSSSNDVDDASCDGHRPRHYPEPPCPGKVVIPDGHAEHEANGRNGDNKRHDLAERGSAPARPHPRSLASGRRPETSLGVREPRLSARATWPPRYEARPVHVGLLRCADHRPAARQLSPLPDTDRRRTPGSAAAFRRTSRQ
jgi:hypothetical protein